MLRYPREPAIKIKNDIPRDLGEQPIARLMKLHGLKAADLIANSTEQITYKMISRAIKGRRLTPNVRSKIRCAINRAAGKQYFSEDLFNYR